MADVLVYHNPSCSKSRGALEILGDRGVDTDVVEYLKAPPDRATLTDLIARMGIAPRDLLRRRGTPYEALGLDDPARSDAALIDATISPR